MAMRISRRSRGSSISFSRFSPFFASGTMAEARMSSTVAVTTSSRRVKPRSRTLVDGEEGVHPAGGDGVGAGEELPAFDEHRSVAGLGGLEFHHGQGPAVRALAGPLEV